MSFHDDADSAAVEPLSDRYRARARSKLVYRLSTAAAPSTRQRRRLQHRRRKPRRLRVRRNSETAEVSKFGVAPRIPAFD